MPQGTPPTTLLKSNMYNITALLYMSIVFVYNCIFCICIVLLFKTVIVWLKISIVAKISCIGDVTSSLLYTKTLRLIKSVKNSIQTTRSLI